MSADGLLLDLKAAGRSVVKRPGFALLAVLTLALGVGANTATFSVVYGVVLSRLPYPEPERLVRASEVGTAGQAMASSDPTFRDWHDLSHGFETLAAYAGAPSTVLGGDRPVLAGTAAVSEDFFRAFGVSPELGRLPAPDEHRPGAAPVAVVSDGFWRDVLGGGPIAGRTLQTWGYDLRVVGVLPAGFSFPDGAEVWFPKELVPFNEHRTAHNWRLVGRLRDGVGPAQAEAELGAITRRILAGDLGEDADAKDYLPVSARVTPLLETIAGPVRRPLLLLLGAAGLLLLVACSNLASAALARGLERRQEMAVRTSLGASPGRLLRQLFIENLLVALAGGAAGLGVAYATQRALLASAATPLPRVDAIGLHLPVLLFTLAVSVATALAFGVLPGLRIVGRRAPAARGASADRTQQGAWRGLVAAEVALAVLLLVGCGLLLHSFWRVLREEPGFDPEHVLAVSVNLPESLYRDDGERRAYYGRALGTLRSLPGVREAGVTSHLPLTEFNADGLLDVEGGARPGISAYYRVADGGYFPTLGIPLLEGRVFDTRDDAGAPHVAVVNRTFARTAWPGQDPLGKRITGGGMDDFWHQDKWATVVGVVGDVRNGDLTEADGPAAYFPAAQRPFRLTQAALVVRLAGAAGPVEAAVRERLHAVDPNVPLELESMDEVVWSSLAQRRFTLVLLAAFAATGLLLAAVGIGSVVSYTVAQRRRELGIRLALGARPAGVRNLVLGSSMRTVALGIAAGLAASLALARLLRSLLYGVAPADPATLAAVTGLLAAVALAAAWLPARRGVRIDPIETIRHE